MRLVLFSCLFCLCTQGFAQQLEYNQISQADQTLLSWLWLDAKDQQHYIKASLNTTSLMNATRGANKFRQSHFVQSQVMTAKRAESELPQGIKLRLVYSPDSYEAQLESQTADPETLTTANRQLQNKLRLAASQYLNDRHLLQLSGPHSQTVLVPDPNYYISQDIVSMHPLLAKLRNEIHLLPPHQAMEYILSFVQSIPEDEYDEQGSSYRSPLAVLLDNRGDIASKAGLAAAMIRAIYPQRPLRLLYLEDHVLIGAQINYSVPGTTYYDGSRVWVCGEVSSPKKVLGIGELQKNSERALASKAVMSIDIIPGGDS